jgi:hypothetical protein
MKLPLLKKYALNCFLLTIPILVWNILLADQLPAAYQEAVFWKDIPQFLAFGESISRIVLFLLMAVMPLRLTTRTQKTGLALYGFGTLVYFGSWLTLMYPISSAWPSSAIGFLAPAYTPIIWLVGIGLIGDSFAFDVRYRRGYFFGVALVFLGFHVAHAWLVFGRMH